MSDFFVSDSSGSGSTGAGTSASDFLVASSAPVSNCTSSRFDSALSDSFFVAPSPEAGRSMGE